MVPPVNVIMYTTSYVLFKIMLYETINEGILLPVLLKGQTFFIIILMSTVGFIHAVISKSKKIQEYTFHYYNKHHLNAKINTTG